MSATNKRLVSQAATTKRTALPAWLERFPNDHTPGSTLYAWTPENLGSHGSNEILNDGSPYVKDSSNRIYILGIGNLGRLYANFLAKLEDAPPITLVFHRKSLLEHWVSSPGIELTCKGEKETVSNFDVEWWTEERPVSGPVKEVCDGTKIANLIVATKAPDALPQVDRLRRYLDDSSTVAFVQNGMNKLWPPYGAEYNLRRFALNKHPNWLVCVTTHGVTSLGTFRSIHASPADVAMGPVLLNPKTGAGAKYLMDQIMRTPPLAARVVSRPALWVLQLEKLIVNSVINPLTAILRCKNGALFARPGSDIEKVMDLLIEEASAILRALVQDESSRTILQPDEHSQEVSDVQKARQGLLQRFSTPQLRAMLHRVGEKVKDNTSSMLQDVAAGKQTEVDEFNGWLTQTAEYLSLEAANHQTICKLVKQGRILDEGQLSKYFPAIDTL